jgi:hypothetical protein
MSGPAPPVVSILGASYHDYRAGYKTMKTRWELILLPSFLFVGILILALQYVFLEGSFYKDLGLSRTGKDLQLAILYKAFIPPIPN